MKGILIIAVMLLLLLQSFSSMMTLVEYAFNKNFISTNLCENRFKPKSCCEGKCRLVNELKKETQEEGKHNGLVIEKTETVYPLSELSFLPQEAECLLFVFSGTEQKFATMNFAADCFHPPCQG